MNFPIPQFLHSGLVKTNEIYVSLNLTSGTINAKPTTNCLYNTTQVKSGYSKHSVTKTMK